MGKEVDYQKKLLDAANDLGGHAFKMSNRFLVGVVDLFIQLPTKPTLVVEVKLWSRLPVKLDRIDNGLTALQRQFLVDQSRAGGRGGWVAIIPEGIHERIFTHADPKHHPTRDEVFGTSIYRKRGTPWTEVLPAILAPLYL